MQVDGHKSKLLERVAPRAVPKDCRNKAFTGHNGASWMGPLLKNYRITAVLCAVAMVGALACPVFAQPVEPVAPTAAADPDEVLRLALPENALPDLKAILAAAMANAPRVVDAGLNVEQSDTGVVSSRAQMLPRASVSANPGVVYQKYQYEDQSPSETTSLSLFYSATVSQPVYHWGAIQKGFRSAQLQKAISERNLQEVRRLLANEVRRTYFNMVNAANARSVEYQGLKNLEMEHEFLKGQAKDGFITQSTVSSMMTRIEDYKLQLRRSENGYQSQWRAFRQMTGLETLQPSTPLPQELPPVDKKVGEMLDGLSQSFSDNTPADLANAEDRAKVEQLNYEIAKTRLKPHLDFSVSASQQNQNAGGDGSKPPVLTQNYGAYLSVNWTLFDGLASQAAKRSAAISLRKARIAREQVEREYKEILRNQVETLRINWQSLQRTEVNLVSYRSSVETYRKDYEAGLVPKKVWDDAVVAADNALYAANNARAEYYLQIASYLSLRGKDPSVNYRPDNNSSDAPKN